MKHLAEKLYKLYINHDPGMTQTYFTARSAEVAHAFEWGKLSKCQEKNLQEVDKWAENL